MNDQQSAIAWAAARSKIIAGIIAFGSALMPFAASAQQVKQTFPIPVPPNSVVGNGNTGQPGYAYAVSFQELAADLYLLSLVPPYNFSALPTKASPAASDIVAILDQSTGLLKQTTVLAIQSSSTPANPTATAGPTANNGVATTYMRSDASPAVQTGSNSQLGLLECDNVTTTCPSGTIALKSSGAVLQVTPSNPSNITSTTGVQLGLGTSCHITPVYSSRIHVQFIGGAFNVTSGDVWQLQAAFGTGVAPSNNVAKTGTTIGVTVDGTSAAASAIGAFTAGGIVTGLTPGTAYWLDLQALVNAGTLGINSVSCTAFEF
jgi:hypothetical protein